MEKTAFEQLVNRYLQGELSAEEKLQADNWLDHFAKNKTDLPQANFVEAEQRIYTQLTDKIAQKEAKKSGIIISIKPFLQIASCLFFAGLLVFIFRVKLKEVFNIQQITTVVNHKGHITKSILADGTIVWLKGNSKLDFPIRFKDSLRVVSLQGEALFEVAKDKAHPFIIRSGALVTRVLGTSFNIKQNLAQTEVAVLTGRVFLSAKNVAPVVLQPFQQAIFSPQKKTLVKEARPKLQVAALTRGTEYDMLFNDTQLNEVVKRIEKKFEVDITLQNPETGNSLVTADLTDQSLTNTLNMISGALNLDYKVEGKSVSLEKNKQNQSN
ncbi:MAG: DUF4974 domain-containing protein [Sphingobacteriaceae bacterium]|nr:MAG: DUF4974 domain-containing protein [Sphingobacteriaceae bacterium]